MTKNTRAWLFAYSTWDIIPVLAGIAHAAYLVLLYCLFTYTPTRWYVLVPLGLAWSVSISWNINGISHNFLHNAYFKSAFLNTCFSLLESVPIGFSQTFCE